MKKVIIQGVLLILLLFIAVYICLFYPKQTMPIGDPILVKTIDTAIYHNDCLHPCIRYDVHSDKYYMAQSPYYGWNNKVENPMFYCSETYREWHDGILLSDTPDKGFNSDPNIFIDKEGKITYIWRECYTPICDTLGTSYAIVGGLLDANCHFVKSIYCQNRLENADIVQCPIMMEHDGKRYIYAAWYQYEPIRKNKGIAIWKEDTLSANGRRMCIYQLVDTIPFESTYTVDKVQNVLLFGSIFYVPIPLFHDLWHFDLFEFEDRLYMVSVAEKGDNIMLSVSEDWMHFKTFRKPLVNNHYTENYCGYRQYYYKPTAFIKDDTLHVFYTANAQDDPARNQLYHTSAPIEIVLK